MVRKYFGTDGIRGKANEGAMTAETALRVGMAAGRVFRRGDHRHRVVIGKDTRLSGYMLEPALTAGFTSMGMDVFLFGPLPTTYAHVSGEREQVAKRGVAAGRRPDGGEWDRLRLVGDGQESYAGRRQQRRSSPDDGDAEALSNHGQQRTAPHVEAQDRRRGPASGEA